jgi:N-acetylmuramoyl-L-alanine amidase
MVISLRSALLICAAMSASSVAPAQVGPATTSVVPPASVVNAASVAQALLRNADNLAIPETPEPQAEDSTGQASSSDDSATAAVDPDADLPTMVAELRSSDPGSRQLECLAAGIYFESKSEPLAGQLAVGQVIANRAGSHRFASSYCGVLFQRGQFSFVRGHSWPHIAKDGRQWKTAVAIAKIVDQDLKESAAPDALFFHARSVHPSWHLTRVASIGNHVFFR